MSDVKRFMGVLERDEARAELAKVKESAAWHERNAKFFSAALTHMTEERDALRATVARLREALLEARESDSLESAWSVCTAALRNRRGEK